MNDNIGNLFDKRFGVSSGASVKIGDLPAGEMLSILGARVKSADRDKKDAAMKIAQDCLRRRRIEIQQQRAQEQTVQVVVKRVAIPCCSRSETQSSFVATQCTCQKDEAMRRAIDKLREMRESLPPVPRKMRTR